MDKQTRNAVNGTNSFDGIERLSHDMIKLTRFKFWDSPPALS